MRKRGAPRDACVFVHANKCGYGCVYVSSSTPHFPEASHWCCMYMYDDTDEDCNYIRQLFYCSKRSTLY